MIHGNKKKGSVRSRLGSVMEVKKIFEDKIKVIISIICFIYIFSLSKVNKGAGSVEHQPFTQINIFSHDS